MLVFRVALFICRYDDVAYFFTDIFRGIFSTRNSCIGAYENVSGCIYCRLTRIFHCFPPSFCRLFHFPYVVGCLVSENLADFGDVLDSPGGGVVVKPSALDGQEPGFQVADGRLGIRWVRDCGGLGSGPCGGVGLRGPGAVGAGRGRS